MAEENNDPWRTWGRYRYFLDADLARDKAKSRGLEAKISRRANGIFSVRVRGEENAEIVGKMRRPFQPVGSKNGG